MMPGTRMYRTTSARIATASAAHAATHAVKYARRSTKRRIIRNIPMSITAPPSWTMTPRNERTGKVCAGGCMLLFRSGADSS